jgi:hypothetical protein
MASQTGKATQSFVPLKEIKDGYAVLKDGSLRALVMTSSQNFALKSEDEQNAILFQFQDFLNSLDFSVQIFIQSRKLDIRPYLTLLEQREKEQMNDLLKVQIQEYIAFVKNFTDTTSIMTKSFFIVVPYSPAMLNKSNPLGMLKISQTKTPQATQEEATRFEETRAQLEERVSVVTQGLVRCGIRVARLGTEEIVELFYKLFNPGDTDSPIKIT